MIFTLMSRTVSLSRIQDLFVSAQTSSLILKHTHPHFSSARLAVPRTVNLCYRHLYNKHLFFNFTPYYLLGEQNCWMRHSVRMSAGRKARAGEKITLFCVPPSWHQHIVCPLEPITIFFFFFSPFYNVMSPKESIIEQSLGIIYITVMNSSYNKCFMTPSAPYNVLWN